ncbi:MAG: hypothetical protein Q9225_001362 [Loekoesia sp. 1 TL-2023]
MSDYRAHSSTYPQGAADRNSVKQEFAWLESLRDVERKSVERAEAARIFRGVEKEDVRRAAENVIKEHKVVFRRGWDTLMRAAMQAAGNVGIVSVGWSGEFIRGCLRATIGEKLAAMEKAEGKRVDVESMDIRANQILGGQQGRISRYFEEGGKKGTGGIWTARDKRKVVQEIVGEEPRGSEQTLVFVGDSTTDLECLLSADIGICIRNEGEMTGEQMELERTLRRIGVACRWIGEMKPGDVESSSKSNEQGIYDDLWWASNFDEICISPILDAGTRTKANYQYCSGSIAVTYQKSEICTVEESNKIYLPALAHLIMT